MVRPRARVAVTRSERGGHNGPTKKVQKAGSSPDEEIGECFTTARLHVEAKRQKLLEKASQQHELAVTEPMVSAPIAWVALDRFGQAMRSSAAVGIELPSADEYKRVIEPRDGAPALSFGLGTKPPDFGRPDTVGMGSESFEHGRMTRRKLRVSMQGANGEATIEEDRRKRHFDLYVMSPAQADNAHTRGCDGTSDTCDGNHTGW